MKDIAAGESASVSFRVAESMQAAFDGRLIHPVLSTAWLVHHLEWASRLVLEPALGPGEEGVGVGVDIRHLGPAPVGEQVQVQATAVEQREGLLICDVRAECRGACVATGRVFQAILDRGRLRETRTAGSPASNGEE
ncbi:MAG: hypothetical protein M0Z66_13275 [Thermaerobacter sp.]|nr:hypothetical protein [Thermaerobacter sp.]